MSEDKLIHPDGNAVEAPEKILEAAADLHEAITDAKAKLLLSLEAALKVGYHMRRAQKNYFATRTERRAMLIESKRLEAAFDRRLAELKAQGVDLDEPPRF